MITNTWNVVQMDAYPEKDGLTDVVFNCHWTLTATDGTYTGNAYGTAAVTLDAGGAYTPYANLTKAQVVGWVQESLGAEKVAALEANVAKQIDAQINPPVITPTLPW